ncbi:hypothetical protein C8R45DRAFT_964723 [Mycena sanguinolenta]|nr:hypothetical protein C8R45DRAFT_964723 [Mycena sanguinolenta]
MSVAELRVRIAELDTEINLQRELLKKLERDKSLAQRQLNSILDPISRLPLEISSEIFLRSLPPFPAEHGAHHVPMLLLNICNTWSAIALSTPALWTAFRVDLPCTRNLEELLLVWLQRASNRPLSISLHVDGDFFHREIVAIIWRHGQQLKHLELLQQGGDDGGDTVEDMIPGPLPSLETLTMRGEAFSIDYTLELLKLAPNLVEYLIYKTELLLDVQVGKVVHPKLRRLIFGEPGTCPRSGGQNLLKYLSLPRLEALRIELPRGALLAFLKESSPPLLELTIQAFNTEFVELAECLHLVPALERLEIWYPRYLMVEELMKALAGSPALLPHLKTLSLCLAGYGEIDWPTLARALAALRTQLQLQSFHLVGLRRAPIAAELPTPEIIAAFRELAADGMEVCISAADGTWNIFG